VEAPGTAPGSEWFIATVIYFHSRRTGTSNIGRKSEEKQGRCRGRAGEEHGELAGFGPVPNCGQAVAFPPDAAPWVGYRRETRLTLPRGWLGGVPIVAGSWSMFTTGMRRIRSRVLPAQWAAKVAMGGLAAVLSDNGSRLLVRSRCAGPPSVLDVAGQRRFGFCWRCL